MPGLPTRMRSPTASTARPETRSPFTYVPQVLRSSTTAAPADSKIRQWAREIPAVSPSSRRERPGDGGAVPTHQRFLGDRACHGAEEDVGGPAAGIAWREGPRRGREDDRRPADRALRGLRPRQLRHELDGALGRADRVALPERPRRRRLHRKQHDLDPADRGQPPGETGQPGGVRRDEDGQGLARALEDAHLLRQLLRRSGPSRPPPRSASPRSSPLPPRTAGATSRARPARAPRARPGAGRRGPARSGRRGAGRSATAARTPPPRRASPRRAPRRAPSGRAARPARGRATPPGGSRSPPRGAGPRPRAAGARPGNPAEAAATAESTSPVTGIASAWAIPSEQPQLPLVVDARDRQHDLAGAGRGLSSTSARGARGRGPRTRGRPGTGDRAAPRRGATRSRSPRAGG